MRPSFERLAGLLLLTTAACHGTPDPKLAVARQEVQPLRLEAVRFYEAGFGFFERSGTTVGPTPLALVVPEAHLDEALRTLVILSEGRAPVVEFESVVSPELARRRVGLPESDDVDYRAVLDALKNTEIDVELETESFRGRLLDVSTADPLFTANPQPSEGKYIAATLDDAYLTIVSESAGLRRIRASDTRRIRPTNPERRALLERAVDHSPLDDVGHKRSIYASGKGGPLRLAYVARTAAWAPTYRLFLPESGVTARLRASAVVHNETDEAWAGVRATFASSRPYALASSSEHVRSSGGLGTVGGGSAPHGAITEGSFEYPALVPLSIRPGGGALVPFLDVSVDSRPIVWFNGPKAAGKRSVRVANTTSATFPEGLVSVFTRGGFAGETTLLRLLPGAYTFLRYADELDVSLGLPASTDTSVPVEVTFDGNELAQKRRNRSERKYALANRKHEPVSVYVWLGFPAVASAQGFDRLDNDSGPTGVFELAGDAKVERAVVIETDDLGSTAVENVTTEELAELAAASTLPSESHPILRAAVTLADRITANAVAASKADERLSSLEGDVTAARTDLSENQSAGGAAATELARRLLAFEREYRVADERATRFHEEGERLTEALRHELARLAKPRPTP